MKNLKDIEKLLQDSRLPDREMSKTGHEVWHRILRERKEQPKRPPLFRIKPWVWTLASIVLLLICVFIMILLKRF